MTYPRPGDATDILILGIVDSERYPRLWTFQDQMLENKQTIRRHLDGLVHEGILERHFRSRGRSYWCRPSEQRL